MRPRGIGFAIVAAMTLAAIAAPVIAPHAVDDTQPRLLNAPPTVLHVRDESGQWRSPFIYRWRLVSQLEQLYEEDRTTPVPLQWFRNGRLVSSSNDTVAPLLLLGADSLGHDVFSHLLFGARTSLGVAFAAAIGAMLLGAAIGGIAGYAGGISDEALMRTTDFVMVLPAIYVALTLRSVLPLVLPAPVVFALLSGIFAVVGAPFIARGVRAIVRTERVQDYATAAVAAGAGAPRLLLTHLLPAARGFVLAEITLLVPAFIVAEATLSYIGLGFAHPVASWGTMLRDASRVHVFVDFPWLLSPAIAIFTIVLSLNVALQDRATGVESIR